MSTKLQAFARVPRGTKKSSQPRKDLVRIDANFLSRLENAMMNPDLSTIMTKTESKLSIEINAQANVGYALKNPSGKVVADLPDIKRIQTMSGSITKERKAAIGEEVSMQTKHALAAFVQKGLEIGTPIQKFHKSFLAVYRAVNAQFQTVTKNAATIESIVCTGDGQTTARNALVEMARRVSIAAGEYLYHRANLQDDQTPMKLNAFLLKRNVPIYIYNKLSTSVIAGRAVGFDIRHLLFPKDPSKGFYLTFKEARTTDFVNNLMGLVSGSALTIQMARNDALIRLMTNLGPTQSLDATEDNPLGLKMANTPFFILPFKDGVETTEIFSFLAKSGARGVNWQSGTVLTPIDLLKFYGTIAKRLYYGLLIRPALKVPLIESMFTGFTYNREDEKLDIYGQLKAWSARPGNTAAWFSMFASSASIRAKREVVKKVFVDVTMVGIEHAITHAFYAMLTTSNDLSLREGTTCPDVLIFTEVKNLAVTLRERGADVNSIVANRIFVGETKKKKDPKQAAGIQERSMLTDRAVTATKILETRGYRALAIRMRTWFRLFLDETVQEAVAAVFLARLDAFLDVPLTVTREEKGAFMDPDDPDDIESNEDENDAEAEEPVDEGNNPDED